jgi:DNA-binding XRE family transcriptional regulator
MLTGFQLKAAKNVLSLEAKDIADSIGMNYESILRLGKTDNFDYIKCYKKNLLLIKSFFEHQNIIFHENENGISLKSNKIFTHQKRLTKFQFKISRIAINLTQDELSEYIKISSSAISLIENIDNEAYVYNTKLNMQILISFFEHLGLSYPTPLTVILKKTHSIFIK